MATSKSKEWIRKKDIRCLETIKDVISIGYNSCLIFYQRTAIPSEYNLVTNQFTPSYELKEHSWDNYQGRLIAYSQSNNSVVMVKNNLWKFMFSFPGSPKVCELDYIDLSKGTSIHIMPNSCGDYYAKYLIQCEDLIYYMNSSTNYAVYKVQNSSIDLLHQKSENTTNTNRWTDMTYRNDGRILYLPKTQQILLIGGWKDSEPEYDDDECNPIQYISTYDIQHGVWHHNDIGIEIYSPGILSSMNEKYLYLFGGYTNGKDLNVISNHDLNEIYKINIQNKDSYTIEQLSIKCPEHGVCSLISGTHESDELLISGFGKNVEKTLNTLVIVPKYLYKIMVGYFSDTNIYYFNHNSTNIHTTEWKTLL